MLTAYDDYPVHQTSHPVAHPITGDRNSFDRYFFNGHTADGSIFFACALGLYPNLGVMDSSFSLIVDGVQHNVRSSREVGSDRQTKVGPIEVNVLEPLQRLQLIVDAPEAGIRAELIFEGLACPIEEPHFLRRRFARTMLDYTRLTQHGRWSGRVLLHGVEHEVRPELFSGVRDRSWGVRPVGLPDSQPTAPPTERVFSWVWAPLHFDDHLFLCDVQGDSEDPEYHRSGLVIDKSTGVASPVDVDVVLDFGNGGPHVAQAELSFAMSTGDDVEITLSPQTHFSMSGVGYQHPAWGHGMHHGSLDVAWDTYDLTQIDFASPLHRHVQALCAAEWRSGGATVTGHGSLEQLFIPVPLPGQHIKLVAGES